MKLLIALIVSCLIPMPVKQTIKVKIKKVVPLVFALLFLCPFLSYASGPQVLVQGTATGLHGHSTANGTDRKMSLKTTGFNPNAVTSYKIYRVY